MHTFVVGELARVCVDDFSSSLFFVVLQNEKGVRSVDFFFCVFSLFFVPRKRGPWGSLVVPSFRFDRFVFFSTGLFTHRVISRSSDRVRFTRLDPTCEISSTS